MPFKSKAQARMAFARGMPWAHEWADKTKKQKGGFHKLPQHVHKADAVPHQAQIVHHQRQLARLATFRPRGHQGAHWSDNLIAHHQQQITQHQRAIGRGRVGKRDGIDAFGVSRPDLVSKVTGQIKPIAPNTSEKREAAAGVGGIVGGVGSMLGAQSVHDRGTTVRNKGIALARQARAPYRGEHLATSDVWHSPGSAGHAHLGHQMNNLTGSKLALKTARRGVRLQRTGAGMAIGGLAATAGGIGLAQHAMHRTDVRSKKLP